MHYGVDVLQRSRQVTCRNIIDLDEFEAGEVNGLGESLDFRAAGCPSINEVVNSAFRAGFVRKDLPSNLIPLL